MKEGAPKDEAEEIKKKEVDRSGRSSLNRGIKIMKKRYLKQCFDKWAETNKVVNNQTDGADTILMFCLCCEIMIGQGLPLD